MHRIAFRSASIALAFVATGFATTVSYPNGQTNTVTAPCVGFVGQCTTNAFFDDRTLNALNDSVSINSLFVSGFNAWNNIPVVDGGGGGGWTLNFGGDLAGTGNNTPTFVVNGNGAGDPARAAQFSGGVSGGLYITIALQNVALPTLGVGDTLGWAQALNDNYTVGPGGSIVAPFFEMDIDPNCGGTTFCPPLYPFQYNDNHFFDAPRFPYQPSGPQAFFDANVYLSVRNTANKTLTVYDGLDYGFQNVVTPDPSALLLIGSGFAILFLRRSIKRTEAKQSS